MENYNKLLKEKLSVEMETVKIDNKEFDTNKTNVFQKIRMRWQDFGLTSRDAYLLLERGAHLFEDYFAESQGFFDLRSSNNRNSLKC